MALDTNIINFALPVITTEFHDLEGYAWYGSVYLLTLTAFQPIYGSLSSSISRPTLCIGLPYSVSKVFAQSRIQILVKKPARLTSNLVGSVLCAAAVNPTMFIVGRAVAGFGAAGILQGALSITGQVVALQKRLVIPCNLFCHATEDHQDPRSLSGRVTSMN